MAVLQAEEDDALDEDKEQKEEVVTPAKTSHRFKKQKVNISTPGFMSNLWGWKIGIGG